MSGLRKMRTMVSKGPFAFWPSVWPLATDSGVRYLGVMENITVRKKTLVHTMLLMHHGRFDLN